MKGFIWSRASVYGLTCSINFFFSSLKWLMLRFYLNSTRVVSSSNVINSVCVLLLGEGRAVSACPLSVSHSPSKGVCRAGSRPRARSGRRFASSTTRGEGLHRFLTWWDCTGERCHEVFWKCCIVGPIILFFFFLVILIQAHNLHICDDLTLFADMASHFWVLKVKLWKFLTGTTMLKGKLIIT